MVDFKKLVKKKSNVDVKNTFSLFESLDRQTSHIELRPVQQEALNLLLNRRSENDLILKISTGAGKSTIGLLYLLSFMEEYQQPVAYLCPTRQLTQQVKAESEKLGIPSVIYPRNEPHPHVDAISAKSILICTYDKLFNALTTFDRNDVKLRPCAFVLDDIHAGVEVIRDSFTLNISEDALYKELFKIMETPCKAFNSGVWEDIKGGDPSRSMELPYWIWKPALPEVENILSSHSGDDDLKFVYPYIREVLRWCRCVISGTGIEIVPDIIPVHKSEAFVSSKHRLFMSATLADDSVLVRELGCNIDAANSPVLPPSDRGLGERMVIAPSLVARNLDRNWVMEFCASMSKKVRVVVLSPSEAKAKEWKAVGAEVYMGDNVATAVNKLKERGNRLSFAVFTQRYDGIDLPDYSCRILVLDGMPVGEGIIDKHDSSLSSSAGGIRNRLIYKIEQGMGRAVRSHADYAVILLSGPELGHFVAKLDVLSAMNDGTRAQLELAKDLAKLALEEGETRPDKAIADMVNTCLKRDKGWKQFYHETIKNLDKSKSGNTDPVNLKMADAERRAFEASLINDPEESVTILRDAINENDSMVQQSRGWYLQRIANYQYEFDAGGALETQRAAYSDNKSMICPPPVAKRPVKVEKYDIQSEISNWYGQFGNPNGAIASIQEFRTMLSYDQTPPNLEQAVCDLAQLIGAKGSRPEEEYNEGPDDLWLWPELSFVIEVKNENENTLHKKDAGQLLISLKWFKENYPTRDAPIPVVVAKVKLSDKKAGYPAETRIITQDKMIELLSKLENFYGRIISQPMIIADARKLAELQTANKLMPEQFISNYTVPIKENKN